MERKDNKPTKHENGKSNVIVNNEIERHALVWNENITVIDLSGQKIIALEDNVMLPLNLVNLNLSHNELAEVPNIILILEKLEVLNLSHNMIEYFDDYPEFCHSLEVLDLSYNRLAGPPYWIWTESPHNLIQLDLSNNMNITKTFVNGYFEELLQYKTLVTKIDVQNCRLSKFTILLSTFPKAKSLCLGSENCTANANSIIEIPCDGLDKCCELERLKVCNTNIYTITPNIELYKNLVEINLAWNNLSWVPNEFCNLHNLEICVLSCNKIIYLPDDIYKMQKLCRLYVDSNELCMLPDTLNKLNLKTLDLYNNYLEDVPNLDKLEETDLALNYLEEPGDSGYLEKKEKLRLLHENRHDGRKKINIKSDNEYSEGSTEEEEDDEELYEIFYNGKKIESPTGIPTSSPEDWDSDSYWEPSTEPPYHILPVQSPWITFIKQKMKEGNFCPMDAHTVSVMDKLKYERLINPQVIYESDGQFDDCSSDS